MDEDKLLALSELGQAVASLGSTAVATITDAPHVHHRMVSMMDILIFQAALLGAPQVQIIPTPTADNDTSNVIPFPKEPKK
jgi:hypothetical protein